MKYELSAAVICVGLFGVGGCGPAEPTPDAQSKTNAETPAAKWAKVTLHINGFKKSKSGAI